MKKFTKVASVLMAAAMSVTAFAGCGNTSTSTSTDGAIKLGGIAPLTGAAAIYGSGFPCDAL